MLPVLELIILVIDLYKWALIISIILTWLVQFNVINTSNQFVYTVGDFLYRITEPALRPIRRFIPAVGGIDLSPLVLLIGLWFLQRLLIANWPR